MLSRRGHRLSRFRKNKRRLRERLRQRIFFRDKVVSEAMEKPRVLVLTGAGISAESGIRTFRAADGLWEEHRVEDVATPEGFDRGPELVQAFYNARRRQLQQPEIQPNAAHLALAKLQDALGDRFLLVTQNIDNLHARAGTTNEIHMHGELLKVRCSQSGQGLDWTGDVTPEDKCHCCQFPAPLRPHVVWFGEMPLGMDEIYMALAMADISDVMIAQGLLLPAIVALGLNIWTTNDNALYASGLGFANITGMSSKTLSVINDIIGTVCALWLYNNFVGWLTFLSAAIPPVGGEIIADYLMSRRRYEHFATSRMMSVNCVAMLAGALGIAAGHWLP